ncbi:2-hydroxyacid dehydrogenase [Ovoidimarina sediminis]|uniref:2-hydroxyacid dehydrogenase n=1 Tax=Ovoidimarina sediminis TaxID=3079856 RepID=UPI00290654BA|nr:2-hydroxyacid dehydrogenase [Rhodophyticola sp. MJ-SS7]MDU8942063.1 2-hydroxyacid dehydrogenase [Rhodophyticola sp. MJ-SS7]
MTDKPDLLLIGRVTDRMMDRLRTRFTVHSLFDEADQTAFLTREGARFTAVSTDGHHGLTPAPVEFLPNLKVVSSYGVGYDGIDAKGLAEQGVIVAHTPDVLNDEVADTAILLWLAVSRRLIPADAWARSGAWEREGAFPLTRSVQNQTVGILGFGRIGQTIAARAEMFNARVLYHARSPKDVPHTYVESPVELAAASNVLICITPGGAGTRHLVNAEVLDALGPEGILINVARGSVVDEAALVAALSEGRLGGAGLDVFEDEPQIPDALKAMEQVVLTPHVGSATVETRRAMGDLTCDNLIRFLDEGRVHTPVPECRGLNEAVA